MANSIELEMDYSGVRLGTLNCVDAETSIPLDRDLSQEEFDGLVNTFSKEEFSQYVDHLIEEGKINRKDGKYETGTLNVTLFTNSEVDLEYIPDQNFERIRRITGYLVGTIDRFNDAKRHEVEDRVKHGMFRDDNDEPSL